MYSTRDGYMYSAMKNSMLWHQRSSIAIKKPFLLTESYILFLTPLHAHLLFITITTVYLNYIFEMGINVHKIYIVTGHILLKQYASEDLHVKDERGDKHLWPLIVYCCKGSIE
jgi:hypothetical protein